METVIKALPSLSFSESVKKVLNSMTDLKGRSRRSELWWFYLLVMVVSAIVSFILGTSAISSIVGIIFNLLLVPVTVRRLHDRNQSGVWVYLAIILQIAITAHILNSGFLAELNAINPDPEAAMKFASSPRFWLLSLAACAVNIVIFIFCILDSRPETNKYGSSPKYVTEEVQPSDTLEVNED